MAQTQVILLERVGKLGGMGDVVTVKPGYARNYLLPEGKALRATKDNVAYFEGKRKELEAASEQGRKEAEKLAKKLDGLKVPLIRQASEAGQLFGSVTSRDIAKEVSETSKEDITRQMIDVNQNFKLIGLFPVTIVLHPEVTVDVIINIARTVEEAQIQAETGRALIATEVVEEPEAEQEAAPADEQLQEVLEDGALEAEKEKQAAAEAKKAEAKAKAAEKEAAKAEAAAQEEEQAETSEEEAEAEE